MGDAIATIIITHLDGVWAGTGTISTEGRIECSSILSDDQDASDAVYEAIEDAIEYGVTYGVTSDYRWAVMGDFSLFVHDEAWEDLDDSIHSDGSIRVQSFRDHRGRLYFRFVVRDGDRIVYASNSFWSRDECEAAAHEYAAEIAAD